MRWFRAIGASFGPLAGPMETVAGRPEGTTVEPIDGPLGGDRVARAPIAASLWLDRCPGTG